VASEATPPVVGDAVLRVKREVAGDARIIWLTLDHVRQAILAKPDITAEDNLLKIRGGARNQPCGQEPGRRSFVCSTT
jgi:hypothetical protein